MICKRAISPSLQSIRNNGPNWNTKFRQIDFAHGETLLSISWLLHIAGSFRFQKANLREALGRPAERKLTAPDADLQEPKKKSKQDTTMAINHFLYGMQPSASLLRSCQAPSAFFSFVVLALKLSQPLGLRSQPSSIIQLLQGSAITRLRTSVLPTIRKRENEVSAEKKTDPYSPPPPPPPHAQQPR